MTTKLYCGNVIETFVIDRLACGYTPDMVADEFERVFGTTLTEEELTKISQPLESKVKAREKQILLEMEQYSPELAKRINTMSREIESLLADLKNTKDYRTLNPMIQNWLKAVEMLGKLMGKFKDTAATNTINYIEVANVTTEEMEKYIDEKKKRKAMLEELR